MSQINKVKSVIVPPTMKTKTRPQSEEEDFSIPDELDYGEDQVTQSQNFFNEMPNPN